MAFSFPYPVMGTVKRPPGQGCTSCVHKTYCPAIYWGRRYDTLDNKAASWTGPDESNGIQCASWSDDPAAKITTPPTQTDLDEEEYMYNQGIGSEADRNGIVVPSTGTSRRP